MVSWAKVIIDTIMIATWAKQANTNLLLLFNYLSINFFFDIVLAILFSINAIAILSEDRFLKRIGWGSSSQSTQVDASAAFNSYGSNGNLDSNSDQSIKSRIITLISATRTLLRFPLIIVNTLVMIYEILLG